MKFLERLTTGDIALWCTFWLVGVPLAVVWDVSGVCTVVGCGIQQPSAELILLVLFAISTVIIPFASLAIWRSSSKYPRQAWWRSALAIAAKFCAVVSGCLAIIGVLVLLYMIFIFAYAAVDRA